MVRDIGDKLQFLAGLPEDERVALSLLFKEVRESIESKKWKQVRDIVPVKKWINNPYYAGYDCDKLYPFLIDVICDVCSDPFNMKYNEVIIEGGIRSGKSVCANYIVMRKLYELSCFENVQDKFNLMSFTLITIAYLTVNLRIAELSGFGAFRDMIDRVPYFKEHFRRDENLNSTLKFPENILMLCGSTENHFIGTAMLYFILDEANFFLGEDVTGDVLREYSRTSELYETAINRGTLQFTENGVNSSLAILVSSPKFASSFVERRKQIAVGNPRCKIVRFTLWNVKPENYGDERFCVFVGSATLEPCVVESVSKINDYLLSMGLGVLPDDITDIRQAYDMLDEYSKLQFEWVPIELRDRFETTSFYRAVQDIIGVCITPAGKLFSSVTVYEDSIDNSLPRAFLNDNFVLSTGSGMCIEDYFNPEFRFDQPDKPRFIHIDQSLVSDRTGVTCCYERGKVERGGVSVSDIGVDFQIAIDPPERPHQIDIAKVYQFIFWLMGEKGIHYGKVTADTYASEQGLQSLRKAEIDAGNLSVDRTDEAYMGLVDLYYQDRIKHRENKIYRGELFGLIHNRSKRKVDHPSGGSKDSADATAGSVYNCLQYYNNPKVIHYSRNDIYAIDTDKARERMGGERAKGDVSSMWDYLSDGERDYVLGSGGSSKGSRYNY